MPGLRDFREQYPQYSDLDDETLAARLYTRFYADLDPVEYRQRMGLSMPEPQRAPTTGERIDEALTAPATRDRGTELLNDVGEFSMAYPAERSLDLDALRRAVAGETGEPSSRSPNVKQPSDEQIGFWSNAVRLSGQRATRLLGSAIKGIIGRPGEALEDKLGGGQIIFGSDWGAEDPADGKFRVRYMTSSEVDELEAARGGKVANLFTDIEAEYLERVDLGGRQRNTPAEIKKAYESGDVSDTLGATIKFGLETGITSIPDMVAVMSGGLGLTAYIGARSSELGDVRAQNKGLPEASLQEQLEAVPGAIASALFERIGARAITSAGSEIAKEALERLAERSIREGLARAARASAVAAGKEAATEAFQEGVIEHLTERLGTEAAVEVRDMVERGFFGAVAGGIFGGAAGGTVALGREGAHQVDRAAVDRLQVRQQEITQRAREAQDTHFGDADREGGAQPADDGLRRSGDRLGPDEEIPPVTMPPETPAPETETPAPAPAPEPAPQPAPTPEPDPVPTAPEPFDVRLKRDVYRVALAGLGNDLQPGGGIAVMTDDLGRVTGRTPSQNPAWFQALNDTPETRMPVRRVWRAVQKALDGKPLGVREARVVTAMLDEVTGQRTDPQSIGYMRAELTRGRQLRRAARAALGRELPPLGDYTGEVFEEEEYLPEMGGEARALYELTARAVYELGLSTQVDEILDTAQTDLEAATRLEALIDEHASDTAGQEAAGDQPPTEAQAEGARSVAETGAGESAQQVAFSRKVYRGTGRVERGAAYNNPDSPPILGAGRYYAFTPEAAREFGPDQLDIGDVAPAVDNELEALTDPVTGLGNERAFESAAPGAPFVASIEAVDLASVSETLGEDAGDALVRAIGEALAAEDLEAFHVGGGRFYVVGNTQAALEQAVEQVRAELGRQVVEVEGGKLRGIEIGAAVARTKADADTRAKTVRKPPGDRMVLNASRPLNMAAGTNYVPIIGRHGQLPIGANQQYVLGDGRSVRIPNTPVRRRHIIKHLERKLGQHIYQGRVRGKTRLGFYRPGLGEIRIKHANDLEVTAHELAHWIDDRYPWVQQLYKQYRHEVLQVSYDDNKDKDFEGYAEFMRLWFTQDYQAMAAAPGFYDAWMAELHTHGQLAKTLLEVQEMMHAWHLQGARARLASKIGKEKLSLSQRFHEIFDGLADKILQRTFDGLRQFKVVERAIRGELADATMSGYLALRLSRGANGVMLAIYNRGTVNWDADGNLVFTGAGIKDVFKAVENRMDQVALYMVARRAQELTEQGRENLIRPDEIAAGLAIGAEDPQIAAAFDRWLAFNKRMLDFVEASGVLSAQTRAAIEEMNKNYVPFNRVVESFNGERVKRGGSPFMRLKGGTSNINDVFDSIVSNNTYLVHMALQNHGKGLFYRMIDAEAGPLGTGAGKEQMAGLYATPIGKDVKPVTIDRDQVLKAAVEGMGLTMRWYRMAQTGVVSSPAELVVVQMIDRMMLGLPDMVTFFKPNQDPTGNVDFYFENGTKKFYEIADPLLYEAIQQLGPRAHNLAVSILGGFAQVLRFGVTHLPTFQAKNFIRDTMNAFTLSRGHIVPAVGATKALLERMWNDEHYWLYVINGGGYASRLEAEGIRGDRIVTNARSMLAAYERALSAAEYANRLAEFKALAAKGYSLRQAAYLGREISTDFAMRGSSDTLRVFTISIPFLNARMQGLYRHGRELGQMRGGRARFMGAQAFSFALRATMAVTLPSLWLYFRNKDDERYQELPEWVRDLHWVIFTGEGEDDYVLIPKPYEVGMLFASLPERMVEYWYSHDERELADAIGWMVTEAFAFDFVLQAFKPLDELRQNKNFTGAPIIPEYLEDVEPQEQYRYYTSDAMIALGRKLGISPMKAEHLVRGYFGTLGVWALGAADYLVGDLSAGGARPESRWQDNILLAPFVNGGPLRRTKSEEDFYELLQQTRQAATTLSLIERRSPERVEAYVSDAEKQVYADLNTQLNDIATQLRDVNTAMDTIRSDAELSAAEKRTSIEQLQREKNALTREIRLNLNRNVIEEMMQDAAAAQGAAP